MGISSTKRGIRTWAASKEYRDNWARIFDKEGPIGMTGFPLNCCPGPAAIDEMLLRHKEFLKDLILQDIEVAEEVMAELGYTKEKAPTPEEPRPCECGEWACAYCTPDCGR